MRWTARRALEQWRHDGLVDDEQAATLAERLDEYEQREGSSRTVTLFATVGAILVGLGAILFVASNWGQMGPGARVATLLTGYGVVVAAGAAADRHELPRVANAIWLLASLMMGANIFLMAQIFNFSLTYWQGPAMWAVGAVAMGYARQSAAQAALAVPLALLALGWVGGGAGWLMNDQVEFLLAPTGLRPVLPLIGFGLVALSLLVAARDDLRFARRACFRWGTGIIAGTLILSTMHHEVAAFLFEMDVTLKQLVVVTAVFALVAAAWIYGRAGSELSFPALAGGSAFAALLPIPVRGEPWAHFELGGVHVLFGAYVVLVFAAALATVPLGVRARNRRLINTGMFAVASLIVIQYFNWSFLLLDRSLVFVIGGALLIGLAISLERKRRELLGQLGTDPGDDA